MLWATKETRGDCAVKQEPEQITSAMLLALQQTLILWNYTLLPTAAYRNPGESFKAEELL